jgi:hypothetical protein
VDLEPVGSSKPISTKRASNGGKGSHQASTPTTPRSSTSPVSTSTVPTSPGICVRHLRYTMNSLAEENNPACDKPLCKFKHGSWSSFKLTDLKMLPWHYRDKVASVAYFEKMKKLQGKNKAG